jgi:3-ketosteroid 9alpha-monooxygenase subunit B
LDAAASGRCGFGPTVHAPGRSPVPLRGLARTSGSRYRIQMTHGSSPAETRVVRTSVPQEGEAVRAEVPRRRIKDLEVMVADVIVETADTTTLVLFTGNDRLEYQAGHFATIDPHQFEALERWVAYLEDLKGKKEAPRAYSLASAPHERYLAITVKEERYQRGVTRFPPLLSPMLVKRTFRGSRIVITGFTGPYTLPAAVEDRTDHVVHLVAGSGVVPNWSILKHALHAHPRLRHTFVYSNKTWDDVIYREGLGRLEAEHSGRLRVVHTLTREPEPERRGANVRAGRVTGALLRELVPDPGAALFYACGPAVGPWEKLAAKEKGEAPKPRFLEAALEAVQELGVPRDRVKHESYG